MVKIPTWKGRIGAPDSSRGTGWTLRIFIDGGFLALRTRGFFARGSSGAAGGATAAGEAFVALFGSGAG